MEIKEILKYDLEEVLSNKDIKGEDKLFIKQELKNLNNDIINIEVLKDFYKSKNFFYIFEEKEFKSLIKEEELISILEEKIVSFPLDYNNIFLILNLIDFNNISKKTKEILYEELSSKQEYKQLLKKYFNEENTDTDNINTVNNKNDKNKYNINNK